MEARRLNQHHGAGLDAQGLEVVERPLTERVVKLLKSFPPPTQGGSWFIAFEFRRPVEKWKTLEPKVRAALVDFMNQPTKRRATVQINDRFKLEFMGEGEPDASFFLLGSPIDEESGGFVISELRRNLEIVIQQKTEKIARVRAKYPEWWLVLADYIDYGVPDPTDQQQFREFVSLHHDWDKIVLVDPSNPARSFEV